jgi:ATP-dependent helicase IRC3
MTATASTPPAVELRHYQKSCIDAVLAARPRHLSRVLYVLPTGTGKTVTAAEIIRQVRQKDDRPALVLAHREELLTQAADTIRRLIPGIVVETERGSEKASRFAEVIVASLPTVARGGTSRLDWLADIGPSMIWYDEAHHAAAEGAGRALSRFGAFDERRTFLVGCTATPHRLDNKPLEGSGGKATFEEVVYSYSLLQAMQEGFLCDMRGFVVRTTTDLKGVATRGGDFAEGELARRVNDTNRTKLAVKHWQELARDRQTIVFCASVEHARDAADAWKEAGATCEVLDGAMSRDARRAVLDRFRTGLTQVITNCMIATEGFDHPPTSCIVMLRPTKSWSLYAQMAGRGTRLHPGKQDCLLLDVVDNCDELSLVTAPLMLDLPAGIDLDGASLREAKEELDELGPRVAFLPKQGGKWKDVRSLAMEVPLFVTPQVPEEIREFTELTWLKLPAGYLCDCGRLESTREQRKALLTEDTLGVWHLTMASVYPGGYGPGGEYRPAAERVSRHKMGTDLKRALRDTEGLIKHTWSQSVGLAKRDARWAGDPASPAQLRMIGQLARRLKIAGYDPTLIATKGDASRAITQLQEMARTQESGKAAVAA